MIKRILAVLLLCASAFGTTTVTGTINNLGGGVVSSGTFVRFYLRGCSGNQPRINGTAIIAPTLGNVYYFDMVPNGSGAISGSLYSTRDSTGLLAGQIECGGSFTSVWYGMVVFVNGKAGPETPIHAKNTATIDISNVTPIASNPVVAAPTGDSTYARLDGGNQPFTSPISIPGLTNSGDTLLSSGKCIKWNADTGICRDSAGVVDVGNGAAGDSSGTIKATVGTFQGSVTAKTLNNSPVVGSGTGQFSSMAAAYSAASSGQTIFVSSGWSETFSSSLTMNKNNVGFVFEGNATITMGSNQLIISPTTTGAFIVSSNLLGGNPLGGAGVISNSGVRFIYTGSGTAFLIGGATVSPATSALMLKGFTIDLTGATGSSIGMDWLNVHGGCHLENVFFNGNGASSTQTGLQIDAGGNFSGDCEIHDSWFANLQVGIASLGSSTGAVQENTYYNNIFFAGASSSTAYKFDWAFSDWIFGSTISSWTTAVSFTSNSQGDHGWISTNGTTTDVAFSTSLSNEIECTNTVPCITTDNGTNNLSRQSGSRQQNEQASSGALTGNSSDQTFYTYTLPANRLGPGKCLDVEVWANHSTGTTNTTYKLFFGATAYINNASTGSGQIYMAAHICNNANSSTAQHGASKSSFPTVAFQSFAPLTSAETATGTIVIKATFNVANTDQLTPGDFNVRLEQ